MRLLQTSLLSLLTIASACSIQEENTALFPIVRDGRWGFINVHGKEVIKPVFRGVGRFSDSLAPARMNGTWGFINRKGVFVLEPVYDYVEDFSEGFACVWKAGKPAYINLEGQNPFALPDSTSKINPFLNGHAEITVVKNGVAKNHILTREGKIEPINVLEYHEGMCVLEREVLNEKTGYMHTQYALQDSLGNTIVPFGKYIDIQPFHEGLAEVSVDDNRDKYGYYTGFINKLGKEVFWLPKGSRTFENYFSEGLVAVITNVDSNDTKTITSDDEYIIWYDTLGRPKLIKPEDHDANPIKNNRTFAGEIRRWYLMDRYGRQIGNNWFEWFLDDDFSDNRAIVAKYQEFDGLQNFYGVIDSMGNYLIEPQFNHVHDLGFQDEGLLVAMDEPLTAAHEAPDYKPIKQFWGLIDPKGNWLFKPKLTFVSPGGFEHGLLYAELDSLYGYVNAQGRFVWSAIRGKLPQKQLAWYNVDFMTRSNYPAYEEKDKNDRFARGHILNTPVKNALAKGFEGARLGIYVDQSTPAIFNEAFYGMTAYVYNTGFDTLQIDTQDNGLYITTEALNVNGEWQPIEYSPSSWCGNSYYDIKMCPNEYWQFEIPVYDGDFATTLRLAFTYKRNWRNGDEDLQTIYSNTFSGKVNPAQWWRKEGHSPMNLMDPYND